MNTDATRWLTALRRSHDGLRSLVSGLDASQLSRPSRSRDWTVADVLAHLGSQAEIFGLLVDAGLGDGTAPGQEAFAPIWDAWNARNPEEQVTESIAANEGLVSRLEALDDEQLDSFRLAAFGMDIDAVGLLRIRLSEHAVHSWDVAATVDPRAVVAPDAVELLVDTLPDLVARVGKPTGHPATLRVITRAPERDFALVTDGVRLEPWTDRQVDATLHLPAEVLLRLVYGRLDADDPAVDLGTAPLGMDDLRAVFPGL